MTEQQAALQRLAQEYEGKIDKLMEQLRAEELLRGQLDEKIDDLCAKYHAMRRAMRELLYDPDDD